MSNLTDFHEIDPVGLEWLADGHVGVAWSDGTRFEYRRTFLREHCPCATCKGTHGAPTTLIPEAPPAPPEPPAGKKGVFAIRTGPKPPSATVASTISSAEPVGSYAIRFHWADGHGSGIYSWRYLRFLGEVLENRASAVDFR